MRLNHYLLMAFMAIIPFIGIIKAQCPAPVPYDDPGSVVTNHLEIMNIPCAWSITKGDPEITVAAIDEYFYYGHPELNGKLIYIGEENHCDPASSGFNGHGMGAAGAVSAIPNNNTCIAGTGYNTTFAGYCIKSTLSGAIESAYSDGRKIINFSFAGGSSYGQAKRLTTNGTVFVVSGLNNSHFAYRDVPGVIHVGRTDSIGNFWQYLEDEDPTTMGGIDILVPTQGLYSTEPDGTCDVSGAGTSIAAPMLAGIVALMRSVNPCISPADIEKILKITANDLPPNADEPGDPYYGIAEAGVVDAYAAVQMAQVWVGTDDQWEGIMVVDDDRYMSNDLIVGNGDSPSHVTINSTVYLGGNAVLKVRSGSELVVNGTVKFGEGSKMIVERGARFILNGGTLTNSWCTDEWVGIRLEGNYEDQLNAQDDGDGVPFIEQPSDPYAQLQYYQTGVIIMKNNAVIENAGIAISMNNSHYTWPEVFDYYGGLVVAENSTFRNNTRALEMMKYGDLTIQDNSKFTNCVFDGHVWAATLWAANGVEFNACQFKNYSSAGILPYDAAIAVINGCDFDNGTNIAIQNPAIDVVYNNPIPQSLRIGDPNTAANTFTGGYWSIFSSTGGSLEPLRIVNNMFIGEEEAIYMSGMTHHSIVSNDFVGQSWGTKLVATGDIFSQQRLNRFSSCDVGIYAYLNNEGYEFLKNCFEFSLFDFEIVGINTEKGSIRMDQGNGIEAAENHFSGNGEFGILYNNIVKDGFRYHVLQGEPQSSSFFPTIIEEPDQQGMGVPEVIDDALEQDEPSCGSSSSPGPENLTPIDCDTGRE